MKKTTRRGRSQSPAAPSLYLKLDSHRFTRNLFMIVLLLNEDQMSDEAVKGGKPTVR